MSSTLPVRFANGRGHRLAGVWHVPDRGCYGAAVVAHGLLSSKDSIKHREICDRLADAGVAALRFDFAGRGESDGRLADLTPSGEVADLRAAVAVARERSARQVALVGSSLGGAVAILAAASDRALGPLVTMAAPASLPNEPRPSWGPIEDDQSGERLGPGFFADAPCHDLLAAAARIRAPWLILHGAGDEVVPVDHARQLAAASPGGRLELHPEADHRFSSAEHLGWLLNRASRFVLQSLADPRDRHRA